MVLSRARCLKQMGVSRAPQVQSNHVQMYRHLFGRLWLHKRILKASTLTGFILQKKRIVQTGVSRSVIEEQHSSQFNCL